MTYLAIGLGATGQSGAFDLDSVSVVPEPATICLAVVGFGGLLMRRRRAG